MKFQNIFTVLFLKRFVAYLLLLLVIDAFLGGGIVTTTTTVATTPTKITANLGPALSLSSSKQLSFVNHVIIHMILLQFCECNNSHLSN